MKILYFRPDTVDCTADPHVVNYSDRQVMLDDVLKVLESKLVKSITSITVYNGSNTVLESDDYSVFSGSYSKDEPPTRKLATGEYAKIHKVEGLYFSEDAADDRKIPVGLTGFRHLMKVIPEILPWESFDSIKIGVVWAFSNDHSCSDYITADFAESTVDYSNQDWWMSNISYKQHCRELSELIGQEIEANEE